MQFTAAAPSAVSAPPRCVIVATATSSRMADLFAELSPPSAALLRATAAGCGVLSVGRSWVRYEGWVLKEARLGSGWHVRYLVISGDRLEYFKEEKAKVELKQAASPEGAGCAAAGCELDHSNVVTSTQQKALQEGDVVIGVNGEPIVHARAADALAACSGGVATLTVLRPKGRISMQGATVTQGGARKQGGHLLTVAVSDPTSRRVRYGFACADERQCAGWASSIKEAIAASGMEEIKSGLSQALQLQARQLQARGSARAPV